MRAMMQRRLSSMSPRSAAEKKHKEHKAAEGFKLQKRKISDGSSTQEIIEDGAEANQDTI